MTAPLPADFPIRPGFWNVPLWGEIGVYVAAVITIALCAWGVCKNIEVWRRRKDEKLPSDPSRRDRLLKEAVLEEKVRQTSAGRMHAVLVVGFFLLFLGTATATLDWALCFRQTVPSGERLSRLQADSRRCRRSCARRFGLCSLAPLGHRQRTA